MWSQHEICLAPKSRGFHLITDELLQHLPTLTRFRIGMCHLFIQHTSASLTINENADPDVCTDMETFFNHIVPEQGLPLRHTMEGPDDMPAHVKSSLLGAAVTVPIRDGRLALGTWQGIYLCEHRHRGGVRRVIATLFGETA
jgi:secondary thiamine-phosphate synthase enzyme